ncbi:MAG: ATP-dependent helicase HepA [Verrucomicrobiales bacterium]|jgi:ATP-dependent helicase HepA
MTVGCFVRSESHSKLGIAKVVALNTVTAKIEYFDTPITIDRFTKSVSVASLSPVVLQRQTRVYFYDAQAGFWRMGRVRDHIDDMIFVDLPNKKSASISQTETFVRWDRPLEDPWAYLEGRLTETPFFHIARSALIAELTEQRAASSGMTGLLSAPIELERHQVEVINRVLKDPSQRYLLADEVGLGKTIEAGVILRQHLLDEPHSHAALIVVPEGLVDQWKTELYERCQISAELFGHRVEVIAYSEALEWQGVTPDFLIVDEAHQFVADEALFDWLRTISNPSRCSKLLLLSATPALHNERGFLGLLHLLDPLVNKLEDADSFRERIANRQGLANLFAEFVEDQDIFHLPTVIHDLRDQFPGDQRLDTMLKAVEAEIHQCQEQGAIENSESLKRAVGKTRVHLSESYRLHRRVLRNRRNEDLDGVLTGRDRLELIPFSDQGTIELEEALENWRSRATTWLWGQADAKLEQTLATLYLGLLKAILCEPEAVFALVRIRKRLRPDSTKDFGPLVDESLRHSMSEIPLFDDEVAALDRILALEERLEFSRQERLVCLENAISKVAETDNQIIRFVFFVTSPTFADDLYHHLLSKYRDEVVTRHATSSNAWRSRWQRSGRQILVCDWSAEEGLNLQGGSTCLIHVDLPLSPNRMEQRIGRLDRFGVGRPVISFVLETPECLFASAWRACLDEGWQVFSRSIASLQYVVDEEMHQLTPRLFLDGVDAVRGATARFQAQDGIEKELRLIRNQDALDAIETTYQEDSTSLLDRLEEVSATSDNFGNVVDAWAIKRLHFRHAGEEGKKDSVFRYHYRSSDHGIQTLISREEFLCWFKQAIDSKAVHRFFGKPLSYQMSFNRQTALARKVGLARLGTPWIDCLQAYAHQDDRGGAFALWRTIPPEDFPEGEHVRVYFRLDYLIEANLSEDDNAAFRRKADAAFPPGYKTLWIDQDLTIPETDILDWLEEPYCPGEDVNIRAEYWGQVLQSLAIHDWVGLCEQVRSVAESLLREQTNLKEKITESVRHFDNETQIAVEQAESRLEVFGDQHSGLEHELESHGKDAAIIRRAILKPRVRLDSCGAVILSSEKFDAPSEVEDDR